MSGSTKRVSTISARSGARHALRLHPQDAIGLLEPRQVGRLDFPHLHAGGRQAPGDGLGPLDEAQQV